MEISIIVPIYNRAALFSRTLDSILAQTHKEIHLILVDNNSTDNTLEAAKDYANTHKNIISKITVLEESRQGASIARNTGANASTSEWIMFFDSDDTMDDYLIARYVAEIEKHKSQVDIIGCRNDYINLDGKRRNKPFKPNNLVVNHILHTMLNTQRFIIRKSFFNERGRWNESLKVWNDWELGLRLILGGPRIFWITDCIPVHVYSQENSLTGTHYSHSINGQMESIYECVKDIEDSNYPNKDLLYRLLDYKKLTLAGLYSYEKCKTGKLLYKELMHGRGKTYPEKWLYPLLYIYISLGGKGATHIAKRFIK